MTARGEPNRKAANDPGLPRHANRTVLISFGIPKLVRFAKICPRQSALWHMVYLYLIARLGEGGLSRGSGQLDGWFPRLRARKGGERERSARQSGSAAVAALTYGHVRDRASHKSCQPGVGFCPHCAIRPRRPRRCARCGIASLMRIVLHTARQSRRALSGVLVAGVFHCATLLRAPRHSIHL